MRTSDKGLEFLKRNEGIRLRMYKDSAGKDSIGIGHLVTPDDDFGMVITERQAMELLRQDVQYAEQDVIGSVTAQLAQHEFDALLSFTFNVGGKNLRRSTLLRLINSGHIAGVPAQLERWVYAGDQNGDGVVNSEDAVEGLLNRRRREAALFMRGDYGF